MILADASVWVDFLRDRDTPQVAWLDQLIDDGDLAVGDLTLAEVLQGIDLDRHFAVALKLLTALPLIEIGGGDVAIQAARNFRSLRTRGITIRKTIDTLIATRCMIDGHALLFSDRDFVPFVTHLGLRDAMG